MAKREINEENVKKVLEAAGIEANDIKVKALVAALKEVDIDEVIRSAAVPMAVPAAAPAASLAEAEKKEKKEEEKKEEKKEVSEEEIAAGLEALFG